MWAEGVVAPPAMPVEAAQLLDELPPIEVVQLMVADAVVHVEGALELGEEEVQRRLRVARGVETVEQVAELKLQIRELEGKLDDVMNTIYLVLFYPFLCLNTHVGAR